LHWDRVIISLFIKICLAAFLRLIKR
jgi:hypothetical protein